MRNKAYNKKIIRIKIQNENEREEILMQKHYNLSKNLLLAHTDGMTEEEKRIALLSFKRVAEELLNDK